MGEVWPDRSTPCGLVFKRIDISARSAASAELPSNCRKGIYLYEFSDGTAYVGKSVDMVSRLNQHRHEYRHRIDFEGIALSSAYFATVDENTSEKKLDQLETKTIAWAESSGLNLRNVMKTNKPGGKSDFVVQLSGDRILYLPWARQEMTQELEPAPFPKPSPSQNRRFKRLRSDPQYDELVNLFALYVRKTIQEARHTAFSLWSISALPAGRPVALPACLTCNTLETLTLVYEENHDISGFLNIKATNEMKPPQHRGLYPMHYRATNNVMSYSFDSLANLKQLLFDEKVLDCCYRLNIEMMRRGKNPQARYGNPSLMEDVLKRAF